MLAKGEFTVQLEPQKDEAFAAGRLTIDKIYSGDLEGKGKGQMLSHRSAVESSAAYVAIEKVDGVLAGKQGSFYLQHSGTVANGQQSLTIQIIPDSGEGDLIGITGSLSITIQGGIHFYELNYQF